MAVRVEKFWDIFRFRRSAALGLALLLFVAGAAIIAPVVTWYPPLKTLVGSPFKPPSNEHPFGTDDLGRDVYTNVLYGARTSLFVGLSAVAVSIILGILIGSLAGYYGGKVDDALMRLTDLFLVLPRFVLALVIAAIFGQNILNIILAISVVSWPGAARLVRAMFLSIKERPFVEAARAMGLGDGRIIVGEILPNAFPPLVPYAILEVATAILIEAGLSFLGVGDPSLPSWGLMLNNAQQYLRTSWWMALFPGLALFTTVLGSNLFGDALNEYFNPRLRRR